MKCCPRSRVDTDIQTRVRPLIWFLEALENISHLHTITSNYSKWTEQRVRSTYVPLGLEIIEGSMSFARWKLW